jgi:dTDP-4-amino-4,6-dideoxygalactose transaminase
LIPHSRPTVSEDDAQAVARVVRTGQLAAGPEVAAFEAEVAARVGVAAAAAVSSGTAALELALRALGVGAGAEVIVPSYVCDALHHAVTRCGATPVLADADPATLTLSPIDAKRRLTGRTRGVIVPHAFGLAVDPAPFEALGVPVIEDCAQALGAAVGARAAGSLGRVAVCSFYATKLLTTGEGGMVLGPPDLVARVRDLRDYDERADLVPRLNAKLTDLQAALGRSQLRRLDRFIARRRAIADAYRRRLDGLGCRLPADVGARHVYHRFVVEVDGPLPALIDALHARGVTARRPVFRPLHRALGLEGYGEADRLWRRCLSVPCYPSLTDDEVALVAAALTDALAR